jgi:hypothetical protein
VEEPSRPEAAEVAAAARPPRIRRAALPPVRSRPSCV